MKILIVDDDPVNVGVLRNALKARYDICTASSGREALRQVSAESPDLVLLDVMMPDMDGLEVCRALRSEAQWADLPVIFVTAMDAPADELRGLELGAVDYLTKPVNLRLAGQRIANQLELKRRRDEAELRNTELQAQKAELEATLARVRRLEGMLSICMCCKKIRAENNDWQRIEKYITEHSDAVFSHGICPECFEEQLRAEG